ncbi:MAG: RNA polymerase sigma factor [Phycisphaeraceae bacterium]|nr:RNA polymerase sigma factor [Phycisphaeraceae bacterium]
MAEKQTLTRIIAGMGLCSSDQDDALQNLYLKSLNTNETWITPHVCRAWLIRVAINECLTLHRKHKAFYRHTHQIHQEAVRPEYPSIAQTAAFHEELDIIRDLLRDMHETLLVPLVLRYFNHMTGQEIAKHLKITPEAVRSRLFQGRLRLARQLEEKGVKP